MARPLLLGHRGARKYAPENTIPALQLALNHGCDGFEFDIRMTSDDEAIVCHDEKFEGLVIERSTRDALTGRWLPEGALPGLDEVVEKFHESAFLNIELKVQGAEECTLDLLRKHPVAKGCVVSSFLPSVVERLAALKSDWPLGLICESHQQLGRWRDLPIGAIMLNRTLVSGSLLKEIHGAGKQVFVWTVNGAGDMLAFAEAGVDGIISDDTLLLAKTLGGGIA
jgi:glycerophosphoryl diester phosphodiesterase